jgi:polyketide synthase PksN
MPTSGTTTSEANATEQTSAGIVSQNILQNELTELLAEALAMSVEEIDAETNFIDLGLDSIIGVEWIQAVNKRYNLSLNANMLYEYPTLHDMAGYISAEHAKQEQNVSAEKPLLEELLSLLADALAMPVEEIDVETNFIDLGLDSIIGVEWIQAVNKRYNLSLNASILYEYPHLQAFATFLNHEMEQTIMQAKTVESAITSRSLTDLIRQVQSGELDAEQANNLLKHLSQENALNIPSLSNGG